MVVWTKTHSSFKTPVWGHFTCRFILFHYCDVITTVYSTDYTRRRSKKTSKLRVAGLCEGNSPATVNSPHKRPVTRKMFPFDDVIMKLYPCVNGLYISEPVPLTTRSLDSLIGAAWGLIMMYLVWMCLCCFASVFCFRGNLACLARRVHYLIHRRSVWLSALLICWNLLL